MSLKTVLQKWPMRRKVAARKALRESRELIERVGGLAYGELAWDDEGRECSPLSQNASRWCSIGAICNVTRSLPPDGLPEDAAPPGRAKEATKDAILALGFAFQPTSVRVLDDAIDEVYALNDGRDNGMVGSFALMDEAAHYRYVCKMFRKAERLLR